MKEISYWDQFTNTGRVEDYLKFKEQTRSREDTTGDGSNAAFDSDNRNDYKDGAYRGFR